MRRLIVIVVIASLMLIVLSSAVSAFSESTGDIQGTVTDRDNNPISDIEVFLIQNSTVINSTYTDENGFFFFRDLKPGEYTLLARLLEHQVTENVIVTENEIASQEIVFLFLPEGVPCDDDDDDGAQATSTMLISGICIAFLFFCVMIVIALVAWRSYSKITSQKLLEHETRQRIVDYLRENPGGHLRGVKEGLGLPMGVLTHHIYRLEAEEFIKSRMDGKYRRFYPYNYKISGAPLFTGTQKKIVDIIIKSPGISPPEIAEQIGKSRKTVYYHVQELEAKGTLLVNRQQKQYRCFITQET